MSDQRRVNERSVERPLRVVSGGQTGVDRAALDAAIAARLEHGGWCPRGRRAEDGVIPGRYQLRPTRSAHYRVRTEQNVIDSDATLILHRGPLQGGTLLTSQLAARHHKPLLAVPLDPPPEIAPIACWLADHQVRVLNVAGPRESSEPGIADAARRLLDRLFQTLAGGEPGAVEEPVEEPAEEPAGGAGGGNGPECAE